MDLTLAKEATFGYSVMSEEGWEWNPGGKLPGLCASSFPSHLVLMVLIKAQDGRDDEKIATTSQ